MIVITPQQLKITNLIFLEHQKEVKIDSLQKKQIADLKLANSYLSYIDSLQQNRIDSCLKEAKLFNNEVTQLKTKQNEITKWSKIKSWIIGGLGAVVVTLILVR